VFVKLQQTIYIPVDRRVHLDWTLPETASVGSATVILEFPTVQDDETMRGFSSDELLRNKRGKIALERVEKQRRLLKPGDEPLRAWFGSGAGLVSEEEKLEYERQDRLIEEEHEKWLHGPK
jgi:transposase